MERLKGVVLMLGPTHWASVFSLMTLGVASALHLQIRAFAQMIVHKVLPRSDQKVARSRVFTLHILFYSFGSIFSCW